MRKNPLAEAIRKTQTSATASAAAELGRKGGLAVGRKYGPDHFAKIGRKGGLAKGKGKTKK